jgi:hypothetical protein
MKRIQVMKQKGLLHQMMAMALVGAATLPFANESSAAESESKDPSNQQARTMKIRMTIEGTVLTATLFDNQTSRDFIGLLPITLTLKDYAATEKVSDLPKKLSTEGAPKGSDPSIGDITYYAPWGNLAVFYKDFSFSSGLIKLGKIDSGVEVLTRPGPLRTTIELLQK